MNTSYMMWLDLFDQNVCIYDLLKTITCITITSAVTCFTDMFWKIKLDFKTRIVKDLHAL